MTNEEFQHTSVLSAHTLLIVDDDAINRGILENIFSPYYTIEEAENGREGLEKILSHPERLCAILLDVMMPEMDGIEVLRALRAGNVTEHVPVFLITAEASGSVMKEAYELGVMDVIGKPVIPYMVLRRVQSVVELYQARARLSGVVDRQQAELLERAAQIVRLNQGMVEALSAAIEFRNGESGQHMRRIHDITHYLLTHTELGQGLSQTDVDNIALAAIMHDVGKIAIPDAILGKPGRLTKEEFEIMKTHTVQGAALLEKIPQMQESGAYRYACDIARHHHALGRPGLSRRPQGRRDLHLVPSGVPGGRVRRSDQQAGVQGRLLLRGVPADDPRRGVRRLQPLAAGGLFRCGARPAGAVPHGLSG